MNAFVHVQPPRCPWRRVVGLGAFLQVPILPPYGNVGRPPQNRRGPEHLSRGFTGPIARSCISLFSRSSAWKVVLFVTVRTEQKSNEMASVRNDVVCCEFRVENTSSLFRGRLFDRSDHQCDYLVDH